MFWFIYFFIENALNVKKCPEKKVNVFRKLVIRTCFNEYFYRYVLKNGETYL